MAVVPTPDHDVLTEKSAAETTITVKSRSAMRNSLVGTMFRIGIFAGGLPIVLGILVGITQNVWVGLGFVAFGAAVIVGVMLLLRWSFAKHVTQVVKVDAEGIKHEDELYLFKDVKGLSHGTNEVDVDKIGTQADPHVEFAEDMKICGAVWFKSGDKTITVFNDLEQSQTSRAFDALQDACAERSPEEFSTA